jgi:hypothetical protein
MDSAIDIPELPGIGFPIQRSPGQCLLSGSPKLIAANHVFHHHPTPRHPPSALNSLAINAFHLYNFANFKGTFEIALLCIQFSKNKSGFRPELTAQSQKLKALYLI